MARSVRMDETNGMTPFTEMFWMDGASYCRRYIESAVPLVSW